MTDIFSRNGSLFLWNLDTKKIVFELEFSHGADVNSVDMLDDILVCGSRDNFAKIWRKPYHKKSNYEQINLRDRVWSVALSEHDRSLLAIGTSGAHHISTVTIFDLIKYE